MAVICGRTELIYRIIAITADIEPSISRAAINDPSSSAINRSRANSSIVIAMNVVAMKIAATPKMCCPLL